MHGPLSHIERPELVDRRDLSLLVDRRKERGESRRERREQERKERTGEKGEREMRDSIIICAAASKPAPHAAETQGRRTVICIITSFSLLHVPTCTIELLYSAKCNQQQQRQRHRQQHQQRHRTSLTSKQQWTNSRQKRSSTIEMPFPSLYASPSSSPSSSSPST